MFKSRNTLDRVLTFELLNLQQKKTYYKFKAIQQVLNFLLKVFQN